MTRRSDQIDRIEAALRRLEVTSARDAADLREQVAAACASADAAHAGVQALADMMATVPAPSPPAGTSPAAGGGGTDGEPSAAARRAPKTLRRDQM